MEHGPQPVESPCGGQSEGSSPRGIGAKGGAGAHWEGGTQALANEGSEAAAIGAISPSFFWGDDGEKCKLRRRSPGF